MLREVEAELMKQRVLLRRGLCDPAEADLLPVRGGQNNIGALERAQQGQRLHR